MQMSLNMLFKRYLLGGGVFLLLIVAPIISAVHPYKHALGSQPVDLPHVEVPQVQQEDMPIYGSASEHSMVWSTPMSGRRLQATPMSPARVHEGLRRSLRAQTILQQGAC
jgi:hypothetical protein